MYTVGIDIGSVATKAVLLNGNVVKSLVRPTGWSPKQAGREIYRDLLDQAGLGEFEVGRVVATGYGRVTVSFADRVVTEISCHARGARYLHPETGLVVDIGGQDSKVIQVDPEGRVLDFAMNDKCAAGTGRFLSVLAAALGLDVSELGVLGRDAEPVTINSMCTVFAESEVIGLLAEGVAKERIVRGIHEAIARRVSSMVGRVGRGNGIQSPVVFTGGVARNASLRQALENQLGVSVLAPRLSQFAGALGAALLAREKN